MQPSEVSDISQAPSHVSELLICCAGTYRVVRVAETVMLDVFTRHVCLAFLRLRILGGHVAPFLAHLLAASPSSSAEAGKPSSEIDPNCWCGLCLAGFHDQGQHDSTWIDSVKCGAAASMLPAPCLQQFA